MAARKRKKKEELGAPLWMVTYGDMVTLLLTFFVMLLSMSEVKKEETFIDFMQAIKEAFGYVGGAQHTPLDVVEIPTNVDLTQLLIIPILPENFSESPDEGMRGKHPTVSGIREAQHYDMGGKLEFESLSAELTDQHREQLKDFADKLRGYPTLIEIRGHCSKVPIENTEFASHMELSYKRALNVAEALKKLGIDEQRLSVMGTGAGRPVQQQAYHPVEWKRNDVVELLQLNQTVSEFRP